MTDADKDPKPESSPPMRCPICGKPAADPHAPEGQRSPFPFCSDRCRLIDLGRWLDGSYQIPTDDDDLDEADVSGRSRES